MEQNINRALNTWNGYATAAIRAGKTAAEAVSIAHEVLSAQVAFAKALYAERDAEVQIQRARDEEMAEAIAGRKAR